MKTINGLFKSELFYLRIRYIGLLTLFLVVGTVLFFFQMKFQLDENRDMKKKVELSNMKMKVVSELDEVVKVLYYFSNNSLVVDFIVEQDENAKKYAASLMSDVYSVKRVYDQLRILDVKGSEIIRMDQNEDFSLRTVSKSEFQNKSGRYYFESGIKLKPKEVYVSKFDLNIENGEIEYPIKPTIRLAMPIYQDGGSLLGLGVVNYNGDILLNNLTALNNHVGDELFVLNGEGDYLSGDEKKAWNFMFPEREKVNFSNDYPLVWESMKNKSNGVVSTSDGEFYFDYIISSNSSHFTLHYAERIFIVMHVPVDSIHDSARNSIFMLLFNSVVIEIIFFFLGWKIAGNKVEKNKLISELEYRSKHDSLTGLINRGEIYRILDKHVELVRKRGVKLSVAYVDINNLKFTNDTFGHESGDELITSVVTVINDTIRKSDYAARLGGDEFLLLLPGCDKSNAIETLERIQRNYAKKGYLKVGREWSISFGCSEFLKNQDSVEDLISRADQAMYEYKMKYKKKNSLSFM